MTLARPLPLRKCDVIFPRSRHFRFTLNGTRFQHLSSKIEVEFVELISFCSDWYAVAIITVGVIAYVLRFI